MKHWQTIIFTTLGSFALFAGSLFAVARLVPNVEASPAVVTLPAAVKEKPLLAMVNELRISKGIAPLVASPELNLSAKEKADDMATRHYFGHVNPDGVQGYDLIPKYLPNQTRRSENIAVCVGNDDNKGAFTAWSDSPSHYKAMINPAYELYGTATAWDNEKQCTVYVNHFAAV